MHADMKFLPALHGLDQSDAEQRREHQIHAIQDGRRCARSRRE
jgi:hypothetical protein